MTCTLQSHDCVPLQDNIPDAMLKKLKKYIENPKFVPDIVEKTSKACKSMCLWVRALNLYAKVYRTVEPKRERLVTRAQSSLYICVCSRSQN